MDSPANRTITTSLHVASELQDDQIYGKDRAALLPKEEKILFCIPRHWVILPPEGEEVTIFNSDLSTMFLILNTMIGSGILVQPYVFQQSGIVACIFEYCIICSMIYLGAELIIKCGDKVQIHDYSALIGNVLGSYGDIAVDISIVINGAGALLSYVIIIGSLFSDVVSSGGDCNDWYCNEGLLTVIPILFFTVPLCLIRRFGHLAYISYASILVIGSVVLLVIIGGPIRRVYYEDDDNTTVNTGNFVGCIKTIGDIVFAIGYITAIFHTYIAHNDKNVHAYTALTLKTTVIGAIMCFITGLVGYLSFRDNVDTNILENFPGPVGDVFKMFVIIHLILYIPGDFVILRAALWKLFKTDVTKQSDTQFIIVTLACIFTVTLIGVILLLTVGSSDSLGAVVNVTGGISGSVLYFILPALCALKLFPYDIITYRKSMGNLIFGSIIFVLVFVSTFI